MSALKSRGSQKRVCAVYAKQTSPSMILSESPAAGESASMSATGSMFGTLVRTE